MAITSDLIGRIGGGGAEVHQIPVNFVSPASKDIQHVADVPVPDGKQARVIVLSYSTSLVTSSTLTGSVPHLYIGGNYITEWASSGQFGGTSTVTGPVAVEVERRSTNSTYDPSFVGDIFWWEVDE